VKALGRQHKAPTINFVSFYIFAIPIGYVLTFHADFLNFENIGQKGLWAGFIIGMSF